MYERIIAEALSLPWAITPQMLAVIQDILRFRASGGRLSAEEIEARVSAGPQRTAPPAMPNVAVIPIWGVIAHRSFNASSGMTSTEEIGARVRQATADPSVTTILYDVSSPGGTIVGLKELADDMFAARKRKYTATLVNGQMGSASYFLGSQAHEVVSIPSGMTGAIGVFVLHQDLSGALEKDGIKITPISAGEYKLEGAPFAPLSDEAKTFLQGQVNAAYRDFVAAVARGRDVPVAAVRDGFGQGRMLNAAQALEAGLIDAVETIPSLLGRLAAGKRFDGTAARALTPDAGELPAEAPIVATVAPSRGGALALIDADLALRRIRR
jgi:signal peptide peptidase SppA